MKTIALILLVLLSSFTAFSQSEETKVEIRANIDWLNTQTGLPTRASTYLHSVPIGQGNRSIRGPLSARACLNYATVFALAGESQNAIEWLNAGQDHNINVQNLFLANIDYCNSYIKNTFSRQAAVSFGLGIYYEWFNTAKSEIKKHNPSRENAPIEPKASQTVPGYDRASRRN